MKILRNILLLSMFLSSVVHAHNVVGMVYVIADNIEGEVGFSNGVMAEAGLPVTIVNDAGEEIGSTVTVEGGAFSFTPTTYQNHTVIVDTGSGHKKEFVLDKSELPDSLKSGGGVVTNSATTTNQSQSPLSTGMSSTELSKAIELAVAKQVKPLNQSINELKYKSGWQDVIGGIGYIFGLCGVGIWLTSRKNKNSRVKQ